MLNIAVYEDYVHNKAALLRRMQDWPQVADWRLVNVADILNDYLKDQNPDILIMPGGADMYFCEKLNGAGNSKIRDYVYGGGGYLGICAGAYYGCNFLSWKEKATDEISGRRELSFIDATATGPVHDFPDIPDEHHWPRSWVVRISRPGYKPQHIHYWGGPRFHKLKETRNLEIMARFADLPGEPPAIIAEKFGRGMVVLSSVHIEDEAEDLKARCYRVQENDFTLPDEIIGLLGADEAALKKLQTEIIEKFSYTHVEDASAAAELS